jgi:hypothetical protein
VPNTVELDIGKNVMFYLLLPDRRVEFTELILKENSFSPQKSKESEERVNASEIESLNV